MVWNTEIFHQVVQIKFFKNKNYKHGHWHKLKEFDDKIKKNANVIAPVSQVGVLINPAMGRIIDSFGSM